MAVSRVFLFVICIGLYVQTAVPANILMITMGGTKSHKVPFMELAKGLIPRGHRVTFVNGFATEAKVDGLVEVTPRHFADYIRNYTDWDLVGLRYAGRTPITLEKALHYPVEACSSLLEDPATAELLMRKTFDLAVVDGAFPECALGLAYRLATALIYINTVGFYTGSLAMAGNPIPYASTPHVFTALTQSMSFLERLQNFITHLIAEILHRYYTGEVHAVLQSHLGSNVPHPYILARNVSFVFQNGHATVTYPRPFYPNVAEIACIHCRAASALPVELEQFMETAPLGVIYCSMGSSVRAANMPEEFRRLLIEVFSRLQHYHILWKWEGDGTQMTDLPPNVRLSAWLPQQDILGHRQLKGFITHGGLLSMYEAIFHAAPMLVMPIFCDHDVNAAKAAADGYAVHINLDPTLTADILHRAITKLIQDEQYRRTIRARRAMLLDQLAKPLETAIFWTEYVLRHKGAIELQPMERNMSFFVYYSLDVVGAITTILVLALLLAIAGLRRVHRYIRSVP